MLEKDNYLKQTKILTAHYLIIYEPFVYLRIYCELGVGLSL